LPPERRPAIKVVPAAPGRAEALASVFGRAFVDDPMMRWSLGVHGDFEHRLRRCFSYFLEQVVEFGVVWEVDGGSGAAVWVPPQAGDLGNTDPWTHPGITALTNDGGRRYDTFWAWVESRLPAEPLWQLDSIAVEPAAQGRGLGKALIEAGLAQARADGVGAFLSTGAARNVDIYGRCGFRIVEEAHAPDGGPTVYFMRWDP
jgi:GNAT superfamily N-acetyltransferase